MERSAHPVLNSDFLPGRSGSWPPGPAFLSTALLFVDARLELFQPFAFVALSCWPRGGSGSIRVHYWCLLSRCLSRRSLLCGRHLIQFGRQVLAVLAFR